MARAIATTTGPSDRATFLPPQLVLLGVTVVPIWVAGLVQLWKDQCWRPLRALVWAYPVLCVIVVATGGQG